MTRTSVLALFACVVGVGCVDEEFAEEDLSSTESALDLTKPLKGDTTCAWGSADCNRCVWNPLTQLDLLSSSYQTSGRIRFDGFAYPSSNYLLHRINDGAYWDYTSYEHVQSIGRIAGVGNNEYMVFTHSTASGGTNKQGALAVVRMGANQSSYGNAFGSMPHGDGPNQLTNNRTVARTYALNNHPGGLSVLGKHVYVAQWCQPHGNHDWCVENSWNTRGFGFSVYDVSNASSGANPLELAYRHVWGEPWITDTSTASVAAVKLDNGKYLVGLGSSGGQKYGFYVASSPAGYFNFMNSFVMPLWGENANIVTDCANGDLYMFQIEAHANSSDKVHVFKLVAKDFRVQAEWVKSRTFSCRGSTFHDGSNRWCNFDAGAGTYVTPNGNLLLYATDWHQIDGNIRMVEFR